MLDSIETFNFQQYDTEPLDFSHFVSKEKLDKEEKDHKEEATRLNKLRESFQRTIKNSSEFSAISEHGKSYAEALVELLLKSDKSMWCVSSNFCIDEFDFEISWKSVMSPGIRMGLDGRTDKPYFQIANIIHEFIFTMMAIGTSALNSAFKLANTNHQESASLFCQAAGYFRFISNELVAKAPKLKKMPPECLNEFPRMMETFSLALAQEVVAQSAKSKGVSPNVTLKLLCAARDLYAKLESMSRGFEKCIAENIQKFIKSRSLCVQSHVYIVYAEICTAAE